MILSSGRHLPGKAIAHPTDDDLRKFRPMVTRKAGLCVSIIILCLATLIAFISDRANRFFAGYDSPLDLPLNLAGNFGEVRSDHWHLGLDIRTNGKEDLPVRSVADGWISRVTISANGYGNAIYVAHDNNRTSLYAHLNSFSEPVADYVASIQRRKEQWAQDIRIPEGKFKVEKGAIIGLSGNTGFSEGPHLHFEWRNTATGTSINPLLEVAKVADDRAPVIKAVYWYSRDPGSDQYAAQIIYDHPDAGAKAVSSEKTLLVPSRTVSLGLTVLDKINSSPFNMGVYQVKLIMDGRSVYTFRMDSLAEANSKEVVRATDYAARRNPPENRILLLSSQKKIPGTLKQSNGDGIINLADGKEHSMSIETKDIAGNTSTYHFTMKYSGSNYHRKAIPPNFFNGRAGSVNTKDAIVLFRPGSFDHDVFFSLSQAPPPGKKSISHVISLCQPDVPLMDSLVLKMRSSRRMSPHEKKHTVLLLENEGISFVHRGTWNGDWFRATVGNPGRARLVIDTVPPSVKLMGWKNGYRIVNDEVLKMQVSDDLGGIGNVRAELDGRWVPLEQKGRIFTLRIGKEVESHRGDSKYDVPGSQHLLMMRATDIAGNITRNVFRFQY